MFGGSRSPSVAVVLGLLAAGALVGVARTSPPPPVRFDASLIQESRGTAMYGGSGPSYWHVNLSIRLHSPDPIPASDLEITLAAPKDPLLLCGNVSAPSADLRFERGWNPPWLIDLPSNEVCSDFAAIVRDPDGTMIGHLDPSAALGWGPDTPIVSGALIRVSFAEGLDPTGYSVTVSDAGHPGHASTFVR